MSATSRLCVVFQKFPLFIFLLWFACCPVRAAAEGGGESAYTMGVFPHLSAGQIEKVFAPLAAYVSQELGRPIYLRTKPSYDDFTNELFRQSYDIAFIQPFDYVVAHDEHHYLPLARRTGTLSALLVVRTDSPIKSLLELKGKRIGLPPKVAAVSYLTRAALHNAGFNPNKDVMINYQKSHDACLNQLLLLKVDVCGTASYPVRFFENKWNVKFRELANTPAIPNPLFVVHERIPASRRDAIKRAILSWQETQAGRAMLQENSFTALEPAEDAEYNLVRDYLKVTGE